MSNQGHLVFFGLCIILNVLLDSGAVSPRGLLFLISHEVFQVLSQINSQEQGKQGKWLIKIPCRENSGNLKILQNSGNFNVIYFLNLLIIILLNYDM